MSFAMRPRFELRVHATVEDVTHRVREQVRASEGVCRAEYYGPHQLEIRIERGHHTWSPELKLLIHEDQDGARLRGRYGPDGHIWTAFVAGYAISGMTAGAGALVLSSQLMLESTSHWGGWGIVAGVVGVVLVHLLARVGQHLARPQMRSIHTLLCRAFPSDCVIDPP